MSKKTLKQKSNYTFDDLLEIMNILRDKDGCPWDREQTHQSIRKNLIEETYEAVEGIDKNNPEMLCEELGDVLLQVVFHAKIAADQSEFTIQDVLNAICTKLIYRHPHIFGDIEVGSSDEVLSNWNKLKLAEKGYKSAKQVLKDISNTLPALMRAQKLIDKSGINLDQNEQIEKLNSCTLQLKDAPDSLKENIIGDMLMHVVSLAKLQKVDSEQALEHTNNQFLSKINDLN